MCPNLDSRILCYICNASKAVSKDTFFIPPVKTPGKLLRKGRLLSPLLTILFSSFNWFASVRPFFVYRALLCLAIPAWELLKQLFLSNWQYLLVAVSQSLCQLCNEDCEWSCKSGLLLRNTWLAPSFANDTLLFSNFSVLNFAVLPIQRTYLFWVQIFRQEITLKLPLTQSAPHVIYLTFQVLDCVSKVFVFYC